jgi:type III pantothenate kinase
MIVLAVDAGNSRIKWGVADDGGWLRHGWLPTAQAAGIAAAIADLPAPDRIVISNVAGDSVRDALSGALAHWKLLPLWVQGRAQQCGVKSGYADPAQLGSDRWAGLIAAWRLHACACLVVNAGTTMTVDALSNDGVFLGGVIVPGLELMRNALAHGTAQLPLAPGAFCYFPDNTADAIMSGAINALAGTIGRMRAYMTETGQGAPLLVLSGGSAPLLQPRLNVHSVLVDNLVLDGLLEIVHEGNQTRP